MLPVLVDVWNAEHCVDHPWWEQAALLEQMGYLVNGVRSTLDKPTTLYGLTKFLHPTWNHHPSDRRRVDAPRFLHVTQYADRLGTIRSLCDGA
jgi:hypothetical protein